MVEGWGLTEELTRKVKRLALQSGATLVGIVSAKVYDSMPRVWVAWKIRDYSKRAVEVLPEAKSVVVLGYHVWDDMLELAIKKGEEWVYPGYFPLEMTAQSVRNFLVERGFKAVSAQGLSYKRLAQLAGFGSMGKNTLIINPVYGPWIRLAAVLTDAELVADEPFNADLCGDCEECVKACPVGALTPYNIDVNKCLVGLRLLRENSPEIEEKFGFYMPSFTENAHLMCMECQKACRYGRKTHSSLFRRHP
ncbi:MAG: 4Fe-4S binding protein [Candidatus Bathyarchaeia archaeon]